MRRRHEMPFGAEASEAGVRFALWAPAAERVDLTLEGGETLPMGRGEEGIYTITTELAAPGDRYRYIIDGEHEVPDPASRYQPEDAHGPSEIVDPQSFDWEDAGWRGRPWQEAALYELHVGTFSPEGTFAGAEARLDHLVELGVTGIELMPVSDFPGRRNWGYDGVLPFAPDSAYGRLEDLKRLVQAAHARGLMVFVDVVYNHFGPEANYLGLYVPDFFTDRHQTPWGAAINFDGAGSPTVREYFIHNALYWLEEYHLDGLRLDAVQEIHDDSEKHFLRELAERVKQRPGRERYVHLVLENDDNAAMLLRGTGVEGSGPHHDAQWNDDLHHALHVAATGESGGYYAEYPDPIRSLGRCLAEGFAFQGEPSSFRSGAPRGEPSAGLPPTAFVAFSQNHDQIGNRAFGERLAHLASPEASRAVAAIYLLAPQVPMLYMGEEWAASTPFLFFCDFEPGLAPLVTEGRREEFSTFPEFADPATRERIPDPAAEETFLRSKLDWSEPEVPNHRGWLSLYRDLLRLRRDEIAPRLRDVPGGQGEYRLLGERGIAVSHRLGDGSRLSLVANLSDGPLWDGAPEPAGRELYATHPDVAGVELPAWYAGWRLEEG
jgi:maltooligosyltrehalose trehalohydrolase